MPKVDQSILDALNEERGVAATSGKNYRTLKLDRGESALCRFLPAQLGPRKTWFARIARHWVGKRPIVCVRQTSADFGGDPKAPCPLCELEQQHCQSRDKAVADEARKIGAFPKWLTYVFVWEFIDNRNRQFPTPKEELYLPNENWVSRDGFKDLSDMWNRSLERVSPLGFLDPVEGYDITISRGSTNGFKYSRGDPMPIDKERTAEEMLEIIDEAMRHVKLPDTEPPSAEKMDEACAKAEDAILGRRAGSRASESEVDRSDDRDAPASRSSRSRPDTRQDARPDEGRARQAQPESRANPPTSRSEPSRPAVSRTAAAPSRASAPAERAAAAPAARRAVAPPPARGAGIDPGELDEASMPENEPDAAAPDAEADEPPPPVRSTGGSAAPSRRAAPPPPPARGGRIEDDPENLPPERRDPAPPAAAPSAAAPAQRRLSESMRDRVSRIGGAQL